MNGVCVCVCVTILRKCFPFGSIHVSGRCLFVCKNKLSVGRGPCLCVRERSKEDDKKKNVSHKTSVFIVFFGFHSYYTATAADGYGIPFGTCTLKNAIIFPLSTKLTNIK